MVTNSEYLNQIASENRAISAAPKSFFDGFKLSPKTIRWLIIGAIAVVVIFIFGLIISNVSGGGNSANREQELTTQITLRTSTLTKSISTYSKNLKSSTLRSISTSLSSVLNETELNLESYASANFGEDKDSDTELSDAEDAYAEELDSTLEVARLSGRLDRVFPREYEYQISILLSLESELASRTENVSLQNMLSSSTKNLQAILTQLEEYSNPAD